MRNKSVLFIFDKITLRAKIESKKKKKKIETNNNALNGRYQIGDDFKWESINFK